MFEYFYNEILRRTIISLGTLLNKILIKQDDSIIQKLPGGSAPPGPPRRLPARVGAGVGTYGGQDGHREGVVLVFPFPWITGA